MLSSSSSPSNPSLPSPPSFPPPLGSSTIPSQPPHIIHVAVQHPPYQVYQYLHTESLAAGICVQVPFGAMTKLGVVVRAPAPLGQRGSAPAATQLKPIDRVIHELPILSDELMRLAEFLAQYYLHPLGDVLKTMQSYGASSIQNWWMVRHWPAASSSPFTAESVELTLHKVFGSRSQLRAKTFFKNFRQHYHNLEQLVESRTPSSSRAALNQLMQAQVILRKYAPPPTARSGTQPSASAHQPKEQPTRAQLNAQGLKSPNAHQLQILGSITPRLDTGFDRPHLIHGVTGSGKTQVYMHLIHHLLTTTPCAQALVMVPEISLTPQIHQTFAAVFGARVGVVHSAMPSHHKQATLEACRSQQLQVLIGPRSSVFAPLSKLKLIIIDEEHDSSYKQSSGLLYHGRDTAIMRGKLENATVVLGSATPAVESYHHALSGKYMLHRLPERTSGAQLPKATVITTTPSTHKAKLMSPEHDVFLPHAKQASISPSIITALKENYQQGYQAMVIVQRRGYSQYVLDLNSKEVIQCQNCSVSLTLHQHPTQLLCHSCGYMMPLSQLHQQHPQATLAAVGQGSEQAYAFLQQAIPKARLARLDSDLPRLRTQMPQILADFREHNIDILVGTHMLAKGHNFPRVTLSALIEIDQMLRFPDFRAGEKTFQLLVQASGRSGRGILPGQVMIQSSRPHHHIIQTALRHDYPSFYEQEITFRQLFGYPPYSYVIHIEMQHQREPVLDHLASKLSHRWLRPGQCPRSLKVLGPTIPVVARLAGARRRTITLLSSQRPMLHQFAHELTQWLTLQRPRIQFKVDVDPQSVI